MAPKGKGGGKDKGGGGKDNGKGQRKVVGDAQEGGKGGGKVKGAQQINVRHILVCFSSSLISQGYCRGMGWISMSDLGSAGNIVKKKKRWRSSIVVRSLMRLRGSLVRIRLGLVSLCIGE